MFVTYAYKSAICRAEPKTLGYLIKRKSKNHDAIGMLRNGNVVQAVSVESIITSPAKTVLLCKMQHIILPIPMIESVS